MKRGANTFPFHNLLPYSESNEGLFLFFSPSLNWIKEKSVASLAIRTFAIQKLQSQFTVLHYATEWPSKQTVWLFASTLSRIQSETAKELRMQHVLRQKRHRSRGGDS